MKNKGFVAFIIPVVCWVPIAVKLWLGHKLAEMQALFLGVPLLEIAVTATVASIVWFAADILVWGPRREQKRRAADEVRSSRNERRSSQNFLNW